MDFISISDVVLAGIAFVGFYYSQRALGSFRKDVMQRVFALIGISFFLVGLGSTIEATAGVMGYDLTAIPLFRIVGITSAALVMIAVLSFLRWVEMPTAQETR